MKNKREQKRSNKKSELYLRILKEQGIDPKAQAQAYKIAYDIPPLEIGKQISKVRTPVTQMFKDIVAENGGEVGAAARSKTGKHTVQKPFEFETAKRMRLQQELASNDDTENVENEEGNVRLNKPSLAS